MLQIFGWVVLAFILFAAFVVLVVWSIVKKEWVKFLYGLLILASLITTLGYTGYKTVSKFGGRKVMTKIHFGRSGDEIYDGLFGKPAGCVKVMEYKDQPVPGFDGAIRIHFLTCPEEIARILAQNKYEASKISSRGLAGELGVSVSKSDFIKPELLGDTILVFEYLKPQFILTNLSKTEGYCIDIWK